MIDLCQLALADRALVRRPQCPACGDATAHDEIVLVLGARFQRITWRYRSMAYALILKDTGVLIHSLCLVAQAMNLGACPLVGGTSANFTRATCTNPLVESSVGELLVGTRPRSPH